MNTNIESLDTNVLLRLIIGDNPKQQAKASALLTHPDATFYVDDLAIFEIVYILSGKSYGFSRQEVATIVEGIFKRLNVTGNYSLISEATQFFAEHPKLSWADCYLAAKAAAKHAEPLWTFDRKLANQSPTAKEII